MTKPVASTPEKTNIDFLDAYINNQPTQMEQSSNQQEELQEIQVMTNEQDQEGDGDQREGQERPDEDNTLASGLQTTAPVVMIAPQVQNNF